MNFKIYIIFILSGFIFTAGAQEYVTGIQVNEAVAIEAVKMDINNNQSSRDIEDEDTDPVLLPFFDDFSTSNISPDQMKWDGYSVFVNKDFAYMPVNVGAATLDAIDNKGKVYKDATWVPFKADELMSNTIRLDSLFDPITRKLSPADSVYFSFFYQPQGVGDAPQESDSLILEYSRETGDMVFSHMDSVQVSVNIYMQSENDTIWPLDTLWAPGGCNPEVFTINYEILVWGDEIEVACDSVFVKEVVWDRIWYAEGMSLEDFYTEHGRYMKQVMIPITDTSYFKDNFRFRFRNYASVSNENYPASWRSNGDQWNIDYVYLNWNRFKGDTTYRALTFSQRAPSFLKNYEVMPYRQYRYSPTSNTNPDFRLYIANLDNIEHNTKYSYHVQQVNGSFAYSYDGGSCNLMPFYEVGFQQCVGCGSAHACPPVNSVFSLDYDRDTTSYIIKHYISDSSDQNSIVDSAIYHQGFYNYYAYDDGTPEGGYGVQSDIGSIASQFNLNVADTLWGVQMYFNRTLNDANEFYFDLVVWSDNNGKPGEELFREEGKKVEWEDGLYHFYPYMLDEPKVITGTVYIGFEQVRKEYFNIGLDANNDNQDKNFAYYFDEWHKSTVPGSLMIRPMVGPEMILSVNNSSDNEEIAELKIYPNPASTYFRIANSDIKDDPNAELAIFNIYGQKVHQQIGVNSIVHTTSQSPGVYIVKIQSHGRNYSAKLLINR